MKSSFCGGLAAALVLAWPGLAFATPKYNPFTYTYDTLGEDEAEIEQYADVIPLRATNGTTGKPQWYAATQFQTEFEYGITNHLELGLYVAYVPQPGGGLVNTAQTSEATGVKQRLRYRFAETGEWPIDVAIYGEIVENEREIELEGKVILQKRFGDLRALINLWGEREYYYINQREWVINPTAALSYQVTPTFFPGVEAWMRAEFPDQAVHPRPFNVGPNTYIGPTMSFNFGRFWWTTGFYIRTNNAFRSLLPNDANPNAPPDAYGNVWMRTIVGVDL